MEYTISIGLNVGGSERSGQLSATLAGLAIVLPGSISKVAMGESEWQGVSERFIQVRGSVSNAFLAEWKRAIALMAKDLDQDAIAVLVEDSYTWALVDANGTITPGGLVGEFPVIV